MGRELARELMIPEFEYTERGGRLKIEDKKKIMERNGGKSPDLADTFTMLCLPSPRNVERAFMKRYARGGKIEKRRMEKQRRRRVGRPWRGG